MDEIKLTNVKRILDEYTIQFESYFKKELKAQDKIASGNLLASVHTTIETSPGVKYTVYLNTLEYLKYIENGTKPHMPPSSAILKWVRDKKLPTRELTGDKSLPREKSLAWAVCMKIKKYGTDPVPVIANTIEDLNEIYIERLKLALETDIYNALPTIKIQLRFL